MAHKLNNAAKAVTTAGTAEQINAAFLPTTSVSIQASVLNTGNMYVGDSSVDSTNGWVLLPGGELHLSGDHFRGLSWELVLNDIYLDTDTDGNAVRYVYYTRRTAG